MSVVLVVAVLVPTKLVRETIDGATIAYWASCYLDEGVIVVIDRECGTDMEYRLDKASQTKGLLAMAAKYPEEFGVLLAGKGDAETGDIFIQCSCFGEVLYG